MVGRNRGKFARGVKLTAEGFVYVERLSAEVERYYSGEVGYEEFGRRTRAIWVEIERSGRRKGLVLAALREKAPYAGAPR